uniref:Growth factor receptor-bound protein 10b n=1 Tax=Cyprinus carpio TaxID=7962 RepID=A0A8C2GXC0_CYPCA
LNLLDTTSFYLYTSCSVQTESTPLLHNGQPHRSATYQTQAQPTSPHQRLHRSQPMHILAVRRLQEEEQQYRTSSLPAIPNPFPELCSPASSPTLSSGSLPQCQPSAVRKRLNDSFFYVYLRFGLKAKTNARLIQKSVRHLCTAQNCQNGTISDFFIFNFFFHLFQIIKIFSEDGMGKVVEIPADMMARDLCQFLVYKNHCVDDNSWALVEHHPALGLERCLEDHELVVQVQASMTSESKFLFRKNYAKYEFFKNPLNFFPEQMVAWCQETNGTIPPSQLLQPRHLQLLADLEDSNVFTVITGRKLHNAPTDFEFCIKPNKVRNEVKELRMLCAEDEQSRTCWMTAFRLFKYGILLYQNYKIPQQRKTLLSHFSAPVRSVSENSLVAMDFSGRIGRVIDNPVEAQSAAMEEGHAWRKRSHRMNILGSPSPLHPSSLSGVIHRTQLWFHGRISREESHKLIHQQGRVDGMFLLRDSQSNPKAFVLTMCHHQKIKHFQILPCEEDGQMFLSLDDGATKFTDLIQLVEFYTLNRGVLPCKLKHPCTTVAL